MFTGREYEQETGLYYYRARYYHPSIGRFIQADLLGIVFGHDEPDDMSIMDWQNKEVANLYTLAINNPINNIDPYGLSACSEWKENIGKDCPGCDYCLTSDCVNCCQERYNICLGKGLWNRGRSWIHCSTKLRGCQTVCAYSNGKRRM